jgi:hypothetical protein
MSLIAELANCGIENRRPQFGNHEMQFRNSAICKIHFSSPKNRKYEQAHSAVGMLPRGRAVRMTL